MENNNKTYEQVRDKAQNLKENIHDKADQLVDKAADKVSGAFGNTKQNYGQNNSVNGNKPEGEKSYGNQGSNWKETPQDQQQNWKQGNNSYGQNDSTKKQPEAGQYDKKPETGNFDKTNETK